MGFGLLTIGYLLISVLYLTAGALGIGGFALLLGYAVMLYAVCKLERYEPTFVFAKWLSLAAMLVSLYQCIDNVSAFLLLDLTILQEPVVTIAFWAAFLCKILLLLATMHAIRTLAVKVGLGSLGTSALRDMLFVTVYAVLYIVCSLPLGESVRPYLAFSAQLLELVMIFLLLLLFIQCTKNICPAGDEEVAPKRSRFEWINRIGDAYDRTHTRMTEQSRADGAEFMRRRLEKKQEREERKKKKK